MESARDKYMLTVSAKQFWELNICVSCTKPLDSTSKLLSCLHGVCNQCIDLEKSGNFVCDCGVVSGISNGLINCTLFCEQFDESILRNNYMEEKYQKEKYGQYITKVPCPNCDDKYIEAYCTTCNKLHCAPCQLVGHRSHHCKTLGRVMAEIRLNLMKKNFDLCEKLNFANQVKSCIKSNINRTRNGEIKKEIQKKMRRCTACLFSVHGVSAVAEQMDNNVHLQKSLKNTKISHHDPPCKCDAERLLRK